MKKLFFALVMLSGTCWAEGPRFNHKDRFVDQEFENVYHDIRNSSGTAGSTVINISSTIIISSGSSSGVPDPLTVSTLTVISSATMHLVSLTSINDTFIGLGRNRIINGAMQINQEWANENPHVTSPTPVYGPDMFYGKGQSSDGVFSMYPRSGESFPGIPTDTAPGFTHALQVVIRTPDASIGSGQVYQLTAPVEGNMVRDFMLGTQYAKDFTLSFWVRSTLPGVHAVSITDGAREISRVSTYSIVNSDFAFEHKVIHFSSFTAGGTAWLKNTGIGLMIHWNLGAGSDYETTRPDQWIVDELYSVPGTVNVIDTDNAEFEITGVQLEIGSKATPFEHRNPSLELFFCQRYYEKSYVSQAVGAGTFNGGEVSIGTLANTTRVVFPIIPFKVQKRATPTLSFYDQGGIGGEWTFVASNGATTNRTLTAADSFHARGFNFVHNSTTDLLAWGNWVADARF